MYETPDYMNGFNEGQRSPLLDFSTQRNIATLKKNNSQLVNINQQLKNDINALLNETNTLKNELLNITKKYESLIETLHHKKETINKISFLSGNIFLSYKEYTDEQYQQKEAYRIELVNLVYELRKTIFNALS